MATSQQLFDAIDRYLEGNATEQEKTLVNSWYHSFDDSLVEVSTSEKELLAKIDSNLRSRLSKSTGVPLQATPVKKVKMFTMARLAAAAAVLIFVSVGIYFIVQKQSPELLTDKKYDVAPGGNKAILTLSNGKQVVLGSAKNGLIANQGNSVVIKRKDGQIDYASAKNQTDNTINYNTLTTQRGGQYQVVLPDGTIVWLNAETSIRYPSAFSGHERNVELISGEAYFEVAHDKTKPFKVVSDGQTVQVLGTHFNINDYKDDGTIRTTLLEGSIRLAKGGQSVMVKPGQQSITTFNGAGPISLVAVNTDEIVAWKNGIFKFDNTDLKTAMRQLQRWYDVDVKYEGNLPDIRFEGGTYRNKNLSEVLKVLELNGVHFRIEGKTIIVYP